MCKDEIYGRLPDLFRFSDGSMLTDPADWPRRRAEIAPVILETEYGGMPPEPEVLHVEALCRQMRLHTYRICTGTREMTMTFCLQLYLPADMPQDAGLPVVLTGDGC